MPPTPHLIRIVRRGIGCVLLAGSAATAQDTSPLQAFTGASLIDGTGRPPVADAVLLVRDGRIEAVGPATDVAIPENAERIDFEGMTLMPGLINAHGHAANDTEEKLAVYARYGVTTVVSLGGEDASDITIREAQRNRDSLHRARLYVAGPVQQPQSADAAERGVAQVKALRADWVKARMQNGSMPEAAYSALIPEAHRQGMKVAAHIYTLDDAKALLRYQVDVLAHSVRDRPVDDELIALMLQNQTCITPTLTRDLSTFVYESTPDFFGDPFFLREAEATVIENLQNPVAQQRMAANAQRGKDDLAMAQRNLLTLANAGVRIALGTDSGASPSRFAGYFEHLEMVLMHDAGIAPMDVLVAATGQAADCMDLDGVGTLAVGNWADFIVLASNPLDDVANTRTLVSVWIAGNEVP